MCIPFLIRLSRVLENTGIWLSCLIFTLFLISGCATPEKHRTQVDEKALALVAEHQEKVLGKKEALNIERPSEILRKKLISRLSLPVTGPVSLGSGRLAQIEHWPEKNYPAAVLPDEQDGLFPDSSLTLSMFQALEAGAKNNPDFQDKKEAVFQAALVLYLEQSAFANSLVGQIETLLSADNSKTPHEQGSRTSGETGQSLKFKNGATLATSLAVDLATLFTGGKQSSIGIAGEASLSIPLLRGSGTHIVSEPMQQAEQNLVYAILEFERFKKEFAVNAGSRYLNILKQMDAAENAREDYRSRIISARRSSRLADAGRIKEIEVDQAIQTQLIARQRWVSAREEVKKQMDAFKNLLGLPPDARIDLDAGELELLDTVPLPSPLTEDPSEPSLPADAAVILREPDKTNAGPLEMDPQTAIELALANRLDMEVALGKVYDAQRKVVVSADALGAELTLLGSAAVGERRTISTADLANARLRTKKGEYSALLTLDLPFDRTTEAVAYRNSFIALEKAVRRVQALEDSIKLSVRDRLRELLEARETLIIQAKAVWVAQKRVKSITLFMDAGRAETRDLLEAQDALLSAQNSLTAARVNYRIAELSIQRDMGVLAVSDSGLWQEFSLEKKDVEK